MAYKLNIKSYSESITLDYQGSKMIEIALENYSREKFLDDDEKLLIKEAIKAIHIGRSTYMQEKL